MFVACTLGSIVGQGLTDSMDVRKVGFTGSTGVGQTIMKSAALSNVRKVSLELGGKSPLIIFSDCDDLDKAVRVVRVCICALLGCYVLNISLKA